MSFLRTTWIGIGLLLTGLSGLAQSVDETFFEQRIRPVLAEYCYECHSSTAKKLKGGLRLDTGSLFLKGGDTGSAVDRDAPEKSLLLKSIRYLDPDLSMPPKGKLPPAALKDMERWILAGAPYPQPQAAVDPEAKSTAAPDAQSQPTHWSFRPLVRPPIPLLKTRGLIRNPIDAFIHARLAEKGLSPSPPADPSTLLRRVTLDLTGLPPSEEDRAAFLSDSRPDAFARVVDRLLASPAYGERWGRYWLDLSRYAESNGADENHAMTNAFRYRDYVVRSFNQDKPFTRFVEEQLAGDLLPLKTEEERYEAWTATGFLVMGPKLLAEQDKTKMVMDIVDEQLDVTARVFMGLTLGCARCHDHKFDPISAKDYYALAGIFKSTRTLKHMDFVSQWNERPLAGAEEVRFFEEYPKKVQDQQKRLEARIARARESIQAAWRKQLPDYLTAASLTNSPLDAPSLKTGAKLEPSILEKTRTLLSLTRTNKEPWLSLWHRCASLSGPELTQALQTAVGSNASDKSPPLPLALIDFIRHNPAPANLRELADFHDRAFASALALTGDQKPSFEIGPGRVGQGLVLDGQTRIDRPHAPELEPPSFTLSTWVRLEETPAGGDPRRWLLSKNGNEWADGHYSLFLNGLSPGAYLNIGGGVGNVHMALGAKQLQLKTWEHVAVTYDGTTLRLYLNGSEAGVTMIGKERSLGNGPLVVGARPDGYTFFKGGLDQIQLLGRALSSVEVEPLATQSSLDKAALASWDFDQLSVVDQKSAEAHRLRLILFGTNGLFALPADASSFYAPSDRETIARLEKEREQLKAGQPRKFREAMAVEDAKPENLKIHIRGSHLNQGEEVPRGFLPVVKVAAPPIPPKTSGRFELAQWIAHPDHPLTWRVLANRLWLGHFGEGLVRSPDNFGLRGEPPSHPELLDWLATEIVRREGSLKEMHRLIVHSSTYQMSSKNREEAHQLDPENRWLWRMNRRRLEAEPIRDSLLAVSGQLEFTSLRGPASTSRIRTIYLPVMRNVGNDLLNLFDYADPSVSMGQRHASVVSQQALFFLNSPLVWQSATALASRLAGSTPSERIDAAYLKALGRHATPAEIQTSEQFIREAIQLLGTPGEGATQKAWVAFCQSLLASNEFIYVD